MADYPYDPKLYPHRGRGYVYIMLRGDGLRKVGSTWSLGNRTTSLRKKWRVSIEVERTWEMGYLSAMNVERYVHHALRFKRAPVNSYECYDLPLNALVAAVERAMRSVKRDLPLGLDQPPHETIEDLRLAALAKVAEMHRLNPPEPFVPDPTRSYVPARVMDAIRRVNEFRVVLRRYTVKRRLADYRAAHPEVVVPEFKKRVPK